MVEKLPEVKEDFTTNVPGLYVVGDLSGVPLLKLSADSGARSVAHLLADKNFINRKQESRDGEEVLDLVIIGGGVSGFAAALEAEAHQLRYTLLEASQPFSTLINFPKGKPIYTYPSEMLPAGQLQFTATVKEPLVAEMKAQTEAVTHRQARCEQVVRSSGLLRVDLADGKPIWAHRVVVAIGRSGNYRKLAVPGEETDKVYNRLHDPKDFADKKVLVVGGGDSALETAIAVAQCGGQVTLSYRKPEFSRPKPDNLAGLESYTSKQQARGKITQMMASQVKAIQPNQVTIQDGSGQEVALENDVVFSLIGREAPLDFFRRSGVRIKGESTAPMKLALLFFALLVIVMYDWKNKAFLEGLWSLSAFPNNLPSLLTGLGFNLTDRSTLLGTIAISMKSRSFYYTLLYTSAIGYFGWQRIRRRRTPYVTLQTSSLFLVQFLPLFLIPEIVLPWLDYNGFFQTGWVAHSVDNLFELYISSADYAAGHWPEWGHPRAYWRAYGFILAWPLNSYNMNTATINHWWIVIGSIQTFVIIPALVYRYGKGAYCGWICSCGGLAETMGDSHRHKMPHGPTINKWNMIGQAFLALAAFLMLLRIFTWLYPQSWAGEKLIENFTLILDGKDGTGHLVNPISYNWFVDILFGGIFGVAFYFKYSGRVWCRFACPLAALMHIYARFSSFRIVTEKKKCISCNVCTTVCHQGIDVMGFANKGLAMEDPQCVRCSACVQSCPTGTLQFGRVDRQTGEVITLDSLPASPVLMREKINV